MGNCSVKAVADAANGVESIHIITPHHHHHHHHQHGLKGPKIVPSRVAGADHFRLKREAAAAVNPRFTAGKKSVEVMPTPRNGVWKVKLVVDPRDLEEILSEQVNAETLIQKMRIAAVNSHPRRSAPPKGYGGVGGGGPHLPYMCSYKS